jgi:hypothetical protein
MNPIIWARQAGAKLAALLLLLSKHRSFWVLFVTASIGLLAWLIPLTRQLFMALSIISLGAAAILWGRQNLRKVRGPVAVASALIFLTCGMLSPSHRGGGIAPSNVVPVASSPITAISNNEPTKQPPSGNFVGITENDDGLSKTKLSKGAIACDRIKDEAYTALNTTLAASDQAVRLWITRSHKACIILAEVSEVRVLSKTTDDYYRVAIKAEGWHRRWVTGLDFQFVGVRQPRTKSIEAANPPEQVAQLDPGWWRLKRDAMGCSDKSVLDKLASIGSSGDRDAFMRYGEEAINSGECKELKSGTAVFPDQSDFGMFSGSACVRAKGETDCFWVNQEALGD